MNIVYLTPLSSFKNGLRSDTLWGLICWGIRNVYSEEKLAEFLDSCLRNPDQAFRVSSTMPFLLKGGKRYHYFPRPLLPPFDWAAHLKKEPNKTKRIESGRYIKKFKKVKLIEQHLFEKVIAGELDEEQLFAQFRHWSETKKQNNPAEAAEPFSFDGFRTDDILHNTIDRLNSTTLQEGGGLFTKTETYAVKPTKERDEKAGLFFLMSGAAEYRPLVDAALRFLGHFGFGGENSNGKNHFAVETADFDLRTSAEADCTLTLSLVSPAEADIQLMKQNPSLCWYDITTRKGKLGGHFRQVKKFWKAALPVFTEGSVFPYAGGRAYGRISEILHEDTLPFTAYNCGLAFLIPMKLKV